MEKRERDGALNLSYEFEYLKVLQKLPLQPLCAVNLIGGILLIFLKLTIIYLIYNEKNRAKLGF